MPYQDDFPPCFTGAPLSSGFNGLSSLYRTTKSPQSSSSPSAESWMADFNDFSQNAFRSASARGEAEESSLFNQAPLDSSLRGKSPPARQRTAQACDKCRERKTKCSGHRPICSRCTVRGLTCEYSVRETRVRAPARSRSKARREETNDSEYAGSMPTPAYRSRLGGGRTNAFAPSSLPYPRSQIGLAKETAQDESPILPESPLPRSLPVSYISRRIYPISTTFNQPMTGAGLPSSVLDAPLPFDSPTYILPSGQASHQLSYPAICATQGGYTTMTADSAGLALQPSACQQSDFETRSALSFPNYWPSLPRNPLPIPDLFPAMGDVRTYAAVRGSASNEFEGEQRYPSPFSSDNSNPSTSSPSAQEIEVPSSTPSIPIDLNTFPGKAYDLEAGLDQDFGIPMFSSLPRLNGEHSYGTRDVRGNGFSSR